MKVLKTKAERAETHATCRVCDWKDAGESAFKGAHEHNLKTGHDVELDSWRLVVFRQSEVPDDLEIAGPPVRAARRQITADGLRRGFWSFLLLVLVLQLAGVVLAVNGLVATGLLALAFSTLAAGVVGACAGVAVVGEGRFYVDWSDDA